MPITEEMINIASKVKLEFERILKDMEVVMDNLVKLTQLGRKAKDLQTKHSAFIFKHKSAKYDKSNVCDTRKKTKGAAIYWRAKDHVIYKKWLIFINIANRLLEYYDTPEVDEVVDVVEVSSTVASKNEQSNEQVLVPGTDGTMVELNQSLQPGAKANSDRVTTIRGGSGTFRKLEEEVVLLGNQFHIFSSLTVLITYI